jgi:N-acetyl-anhydromuramyl-L-alanine amidase AmpD
MLGRAAAPAHLEAAVAYPFVESPHVTRVPQRRIDTVVIHTMEIAEREVSQVSAHYCVDAGTVIQCVREQDVAWHARGGNATSIGIELAGMAGQGSHDWEDAYSDAVLARAAELTADVCRRHRIPVRRLGPDRLRAGGRGITGHADVTEAFGKSDHWDPGPGFPWEAFLRRVRAAQPSRRRQPSGPRS